MDPRPQLHLPLHSSTHLPSDSPRLHRCKSNLETLLPSHHRSQNSNSNLNPASLYPHSLDSQSVPFPPSNENLVYGKTASCKDAIDRCRDALSLSHFTLLKRLGCGDIGSVFLVQLKGSNCCFAVKMMSKEILASRKKFHRAYTERSILQSLHHPFLPTLYAHFETDKFLCMVMEFCSGGDLHSLRQRQPNRHFSETAARFYAAEVLLALEYLHMMGVIYRDLKPENILIREDGHIMLSDFDLSLQCAVKPMLVKSSSVNRSVDINIQPVCLNPPCIQPSCLIPPHLLKSRRKRLGKGELGNQVTPLPELLAEPTGTQSMSFVGTYEYIAPEIITGEGHGSAVDWWTFGILLYELLYGTTPFKGEDNKTILCNIIGKPLKFPHTPRPSSAAQDLIRGLLVKDPEERLGSRRGATEIKKHPFFKGINWALMRSIAPPEVPLSFQLSSGLDYSVEASGFESF